MAFEIVVAQFLRFIVVDGFNPSQNGLAEVLNRVEVLQQRIEVAGVAQLIQSSRPFRSCRSRNLSRYKKKKLCFLTLVKILHLRS